jgi:hypothetical protein
MEDILEEDFWPALLLDPEDSGIEVQGIGV